MNNEIRALARLLPDPARHEPPEGRLHLLRESFMEQITQAQADAPEVPATPPRRRRRLVPALVGGSMAFVVALWLTSAFVLGVGRFWAGRTDAGDLLNRIALVAANSTDIPPLDQIHDDQYVYIETYGGWGGWGAVPGPDGEITGGWVGPEPGHRQVWQSVDGSRPGLLREEGTDGDRETSLDPNPRPDLHGPTLRYLASLPTDPDLLLMKIYWENGTMGPNPQQEAFVTIGDLIRGSIVPADVAVALYQAAARIPGIEVVPDVTDALGRPGIAVARTHAGVRHELIFDRDTLQFLGERSVLTAGAEAPAAAAPVPEPSAKVGADPAPTASAGVGAVSAPEGFVLGSTAVVTRAIVDAPGQVPGD